MDVATVLNAAADLLEKPGAWTQRHAARDIHRTGVMYDNPDAVCWCAWGALAKVSQGNEIDAFTALTEHLHLEREIDPAWFGDTWNDAPERTQAEVVAALRQAALSHRPKEATDD